MNYSFILEEQFSIPLVNYLLQNFDLNLSLQASWIKSTCPSLNLLVIDEKTNVKLLFLLSYTVKASNLEQWGNWNKPDPGQVTAAQ